MDAELMKVAIEFADKLTSTAFLLFMLGFLIKENQIMKELLFGDWKRQREEEIEARVKARLSKELNASSGSGI
jgi:hypothetical protein